jgi:glutamate---cysteine ligase / carboxylate-amine ligase
MGSLPPQCSSLPHRFGSSPAFTVGVEEELFLVDPSTHAISRRTDAVLSRLPRFTRGQVLGEMCDGVVELVTPVCRDAAEVTRHLGALRAAVSGGGDTALMGVGVHPSAAYGDVAHRPGRHYAAVAADTRSLLRQSAYCGLHVHVGMPDPETAVAAFNGMRKWVPVLQALSANSPFWYGRDSGLASSRAVLCHSVPRTRLPGAFHDWDHYQRVVQDLVVAGELDGVGSIWWDVRLHPGHGTLEVRLADAQSSLADVAGLTALIHGLVRHEALVADLDHPDRDLLDEATFRAIRDGLDARVAIGGPMRHMQDLAAHALAVAFPYAARAGCADALDHVERMLDMGNGAMRQRAAFADGGMPAVLRHLVAETVGAASARALVPAPAPLSLAGAA